MYRYISLPHEQTDMTENITFPKLWWAVKNERFLIADICEDFVSEGPFFGPCDAAIDCDETGFNRRDSCQRTCGLCTPSHTGMVQSITYRYGAINPIQVWYNQSHTGMVQSIPYRYGTINHTQVWYNESHTGMVQSILYRYGTINPIQVWYNQSHTGMVQSIPYRYGTINPIEVWYNQSRTGMVQSIP